MDSLYSLSLFTMMQTLQILRLTHRSLGSQEVTSGEPKAAWETETAQREG